MKTLSFILILFTFNAKILAQNCTWNANKNTSKVTWTAFKTTAKTPVSGTFKDVSLVQVSAQKSPPSSLEDWMLSQSLAINVKSVDTQNPARDKTLFENFFGLMKNTLDYTQGEIFILGKIKSLDAKKGTLLAEMEINAVKKSLPLNYKYLNNKLEITGSLDVFDFALQEAHSKLHKACYELHKGADGVSKTWSQVDLKGEIEITKDCK